MSPLETTGDRYINALDRAVNNIAIQFAPQIIMASGNTDDESYKIIIMLKEVKSFEDFRTFKKFLEDNIGGIKSVVQSRIKGNNITMSVEFTGARDTFINRLKDSRKFHVSTETSDSSGVDLVITIEHEMMDPIAGRNADIQ